MIFRLTVETKTSNKDFVRVLIRSRIFSIDRTILEEICADGLDHNCSLYVVPNKEDVFKIVMNISHVKNYLSLIRY